MNPSPAPHPTPKFVWIALALIAVVTVAGINWIEWLKNTSLCAPDPTFWINTFYVVIARTEPAGLFILLAFCIFSAWLFLKKQPLFTWREIRFSSQRIVLILAISHFIFSWAGTWLITQRHPLACDEYMPDFQAQIFLAGKLQGDIPPDLQFIAPSLQPLLSFISRDHARWNSGYLPIYSALRTPFLALHLETLVNPILGAIAIFFMGAIIRLLWPGKPWLVVAGAAMIAFSPQILINDMTVYAMPAHLALNTIWLWLWLQPEKRRFWLAPFVGVLAIGLHNPFVHALFVTPFLLRMVLNRRWKATAIFAIIYLLGCAGFWYWWHIFVPPNPIPGRPLFSWDLFLILYSQPLNLLNLISWNTLPCAFLGLIGIRFYKNLPTPVGDAFFACLLTFGFYMIVNFDQSYGWGNRYCYGILGCLVLLAVGGLNEWHTRFPDGKSGQFVTSGLILTILFSLPLRCFQVESFIKPFASAQQGFQKTDADLVVFDSRMAWNSCDLLRNTPFLTNRPLLVDQKELTRENALLLKKKFSRIHFVTREELTSYGLFTQPWKAQGR